MPLTSYDWTRLMIHKLVFKSCTKLSVCLLLSSVSAPLSANSETRSRLLEEHIVDLQNEVKELWKHIEDLERRLPNSSQPPASPQGPNVPPSTPSTPGVSNPLVPTALPIESSPTGAPLPPPAETSLTAEAQYNQALDLLKAHRFVEARAAFESFLMANPGHSFHILAKYWVGVICFVEKRYAEALTLFRSIESQAGAKRHDVLLKIVLCHKNLGDSASALTVLKGLKNLLEKSPERKDDVSMRTQIQTLESELSSDKTFS